MYFKVQSGHHHLCKIVVCSRQYIVENLLSLTTIALQLENIKLKKISIYVKFQQGKKKQHTKPPPPPPPKKKTKKTTTRSARLVRLQIKHQIFR